MFSTSFLKALVIFLFTITSNASDSNINNNSQTNDDKRKAAIYFQKELQKNYTAELYYDSKTDHYYILIDKIKEKSSWFWNLFEYDKGWYELLFYKRDTKEDIKYICAIKKCVFWDETKEKWWGGYGYNRPRKYLEFELIRKK